MGRGTNIVELSRWKKKEERERNKIERNVLTSIAIDDNCCIVQSTISMIQDRFADCEKPMIRTFAAEARVANLVELRGLRKRDDNHVVDP